ncbi:MAG: hypothetical protein WCR80_03090 [Bacilli bacterium]
MNMIKNFYVESDLKILLGWLGINYRKAMRNRIILSIFFCLIFVFLGLYLKNTYLLIFSIAIGIAYYKYQYYSIKKRKSKFTALKRRMFPAFVKKVLILIRTNNIYTSLIKMIPYTDDPIKLYLQELIEEIKNDKSITPFTNFANKMEFVEAYQIMAVLYTFSEHSMSKKHLMSLETMISNLYDNEIDEIIENKKRMLWLYPNFCIISMLFLVFSLAIFMFLSIMSEVNLS